MSSLVLPLNIGPRIREMLPTPGPRADTRCPPETAFEVIMLPMRAAQLRGILLLLSCPGSQRRQLHGLFRKQGSRVASLGRLGGLGGVAGSWITVTACWRTTQ